MNLTMPSGPKALVNASIPFWRIKLGLFRSMAALLVMAEPQERLTCEYGFKLAEKPGLGNKKQPPSAAPPA
jgi:hypothetical protein